MKRLLYLCTQPSFHLALDDPSNVAPKTVYSLSVMQNKILHAAYIIKPWDFPLFSYFTETAVVYAQGNSDLQPMPLFMRESRGKNPSLSRLFRKFTSEEIALTGPEECLHRILKTNACSLHSSDSRLLLPVLPLYQTAQLWASGKMCGTR